jgi:hypothetical protein
MGFEARRESMLGAGNEIRGVVVENWTAFIVSGWFVCRPTVIVSFCGTKRIASRLISILRSC